VTQKQIKNLPASVMQKLLNKAKHTNRPFNEILRYYTLERFLYRLAQSPYAEKFILKGALTVRATKITDSMAIAAAHSLALFARNRGINPESIVPTMDETEVFAHEAADVAMQAIADGVAQIQLTRDEVFQIAMEDIRSSRALTHKMMEDGYLSPPPQALIDQALAACGIGD